MSAAVPITDAYAIVIVTLMLMAFAAGVGAGLMAAPIGGKQ